MILERALKSALVLLAALLFYAMQVQEARAVITYQSAGALGYSNVTSIAPPYPAAVAAGDLLILVIGMKPVGVVSGGSVTTPEGWTAITSLVGAGGYVAVPGADTGNTNVFAYYKVAEGNETGALRVRLTTINAAWSQMYRLTNSTQDWSVAGTTGADTTAGAAVSITMSADPGVTAGDFILGAMVIPTDVTTPTQFTLEAFSQTGVTFGAVTEVSEPDSTLGNDIGGFVVQSSVSAGTGAAAPVMTATAGGTTTNVRGPGVFIRVRATGAITYQAPGALNYVAATLGTSVCAAHPAAVAAGDLLVTLIGMKPTVLSGGSVTTPSGWTAVPTGSLVGAGGYGAVPAADTGNTNVFSFSRVATGTEATERCFALATNNVSWAQMYRFSNATQSWLLAGTTGSDITAGAAVSITMSADPGVTAGDHILGAMVIPTDVTTPTQFSAQAFTQTGVTFVAPTEISEPDSTVGNQIGGFVVRSSVSAGTGSAAPVMTATAGGTTTNVRGPGLFVRIREAPALPDLAQAAFRFYEDGTEAGSTVIAAQDSNITRDVAPGNSNLLLRLRIQETNAVSGAATDDYRLRYSKNGAAYANVTAATANVRGFNSASLADGAATTNRLTGGSGTFLAGEISEDGLVDNHQITASNHTEYLYTLTLISADLANGDTLDFRILRNGAVIGTYSETPRITVSKVIPGSFNAFETSTLAGAITGVITTRRAGTGFSLDVVAISGGAQQAAFTGAVTVELLGNTTLGVALDAQNCPTAFVLQQASSPADPTITGGRSTVSFGAVADSWRDVRVRMSWPTTSPTVIWCSTNNFAIRPDTLASFAVTDTDWETTGAPGVRTLDLLTFAATTPIHKAGRPFSVRATAVNTAAATTGNYTGAPSATLSACAGAACTATFGTLTLGAIFAAGQLASDVASYNNVGSFRVRLEDTDFASVDAADTAGDCTATGRYVCSASLDVGRFVPDHFAVSLNTPTFGAACVAGSFTYVGQPFNFITTQPIITVTAQQFGDNATTTLYAGAWARITNLTVTPATQAARYARFDALGGGATPVLDTAALPLPAVDPAISAFTAGVGTLTFSSGTGLGFIRSTTTPNAPFNADIALSLNVIDTDSVVFAGNPAAFGAASAGGGIAFVGGSKAMRFGRLRLQNALGSELIDLPIPMVAQYWNASAFVTNPDDGCTSLSAANLTLGAYTGGITGVNLGAPGHISLGGAFAAGVGSLKLTKPLPVPASPGSATVTVNLDAELKSYLKGNWGVSTYTVNPSARAGFGLFSSQPRNFIFYREMY